MRCAKCGSEISTPSAFVMIAGLPFRPHQPATLVAFAQSE
jgi:hypothetical protein